MPIENIVKDIMEKSAKYTIKILNDIKPFEGKTDSKNNDERSDENEH